MSLKKTLGITGVFLGTAACAMHLANRMFTYISTADNLLEEENFNYYDWRFGKIAYKKQGSGSPLLLIHNLNVYSSSQEWDNILEHLSKTNTIYTLDLIGCGCSDHSILTYTNFLYVELITDFIKNVIKEKTDIIVSGESCAFVLMACANDNNIINRVCMINPQNIITLAKNPTKRSKMIKYLLSSPVIGTFIYNMKVNKRTISDDFKSKFFYDQNKVCEKHILTCFESSHKDKTHSRFLYACQKSGFTNVNLLCCLKKLNNSIYIIVGNGNPENILAANQYQNYLPSIEIIGINHTKQIPHVEKPAEFIEQINILFSDADYTGEDE